MLRVNFNIRTTEGVRPVPIYMVLRWDGQRLVYTTKQAVSPKNWDNKGQRVRKVLAEKNFALINNSLEKLEQTAKKVFAEMDQTNNFIEVNKLRESLEYETGRKKRPFSDFWSFIDYFISNAPKRIDPDTGLKLSPRTIAKYSGTRSLLKQFSSQNQNLDFSFSSMDDVFYNTLRGFMTNVKKYNQNTISKHLTVLRTILREADEKGVKVNKVYLSRFASAKPQEAFAIYLNKQDIAKIEKLKTTGTMQRVKDNLLTGCYTGLRFSDWKQLNEALVTNNGIELFQEKTGGRVIIPMSPGLQSILDRNGGEFPTVLSNQKFNQYVKEVCREAGVTEIVQYSEVRGGKRTVIQQPKHDLVSSHTGRRSFATNSYIDGIPSISIMAITGHRTESAFLKYLKLSKEEHARIIEKHLNKKTPL